MRYQISNLSVYFTNYNRARRNTILISQKSRTLLGSRYHASLRNQYIFNRDQDIADIRAGEYLLVITIRTRSISCTTRMHFKRVQTQ